MAERPLYTLYKNLKAQNYDVPDDYNKFESALTRDGKGGADNRHAIYENLKAQNFDVPNTYERFYSALFEPRSKTSSRAKGGSVPMSAADRARFSAGAAAISASAQHTMNNAGRYNRLKQRKQKQQKDFGRVNLGTHQTPYGGDANNVVKDDFAYNPETGKAGAYVTSDNENAYTQNDAEQKQNLLDKYGEEWNNAVDMGIVPSELDKADPDLSDTDVAMRQMERRQEWLNENQDRRSNELNESMHLQGSPFVASGGAVAPSSFNTAISNEANRLSDVEYGAYNTAKAYNQMLRTTLLQELKEQKQRNENAGWWKDKWNDVSNYFGAMFNTMLDPKLYSQGVMDAAIANNVLQVKKGMEDGTIKKGSNAGNAAQAMLGAIQQQQAEAAKQQQYGTKAYQYGDMSGRSLKFMGDFALSGWRNVMTTGFTKAGEKVGEKMALGALGKWFTKNTGRVLGDMAGSAALAATNQLGSTYNNVIERYVGMNNENGGVTQDKNGDLKFNEGVSLGKAIKDGFGSATIENFSEMFGEYLPGAPKLLSKLGLSKVSAFFEKIGNNAYYKWLSNATNKSGIQGVMAEISEEEFGTALHAAWGDGDGSWSDFNVFTNPDAREKQIDTCLGMFYSVGFMQAPRTAVGAINAVQYFNIKHQVAKADKFGQVMFNDKWDEVKSKIDVTTNADLTKTVLDATRSDSMTAKQKGAVINYAMFLSKLRGFNQASDAKTKDKVEEGETAPTLSNDLDDAYTEGHNADDADKHNIQLEQNDKANELAAMLHITPEQLHDMADEDLEAMTRQDDKLDQAIYDYLVSTAKYQGVMDGAQDEVDMAAHQAAMETDNMTDLSRGTVRKATIKATGGLEDYEVYIISGNIATHDDGSIDVGNSDDMIIYYDPTTGRKEHADAMMFADFIEELPAAGVKAQAVADAKENAIKKIAGIVDGTIDVGSQFSVTDTDGTEHTYEVLADNGDGTAMITIDGNVPTELVKGENVQIPYSFADLQQLKDAEDLKRLETAKTQREQMEKERAAQQTEQTLPSFDFKEILNDNGNVVEADVIGKDGNSKFPNSKIFLIRNTGAKAKVVELKSDGTLKSHAVNKEDVQTATSMSLEEYKQARFGSSMIEDNSGTIEADRGGIEVEDNTQPLSEDDADNVIAQMESSAETAPDLELTPDNWTAEFGEDGILSTPIGEVKMGENQVAKLFEKGRSKEFGMIKPTLTNPDVIIEVPSHSADGNEERSSSYLFIKTFLGKNGEKVYYFKSVTIKKDGLEISISSHYDRAKRVKEALMKGKLLYRKNDGAQTEQNQPSASVTTSQEDAAGSSESKDTNISSNGNENNESLTFEDGTPIPVDVNGETDLSQTDAAHAAEWYDTNLGEDADGWLDGEINKAKKVLEQAKNRKLTGTKPSELVASKKEKEAAVADAQARYDSAISIRDSLKERRIAKEENTPEGRKNLIEKARRKFARLKSAVKDDAEAVSQLYKDVVGSLLHRLYDGTGIDVTDTIPLTAEEYVASNLGAHSLNYEGTETSKGVKQETGLSREDFTKTQLLAADGKGTTIDDLVHNLWENRPSNLESLDTQDIRNALIGVLTSGFKASEARNYIENLRIAQAENFLEEQKKAADNAAFAEEQTAPAEQQNETAPESEEKTEEDNSDEINDEENEQTNAPEQNKFPDKLKEGSETIEVPEDATDEKPLGEQRTDSPFSARKNDKQQTEAERAADVEKNKVDDMKVVDNIVGQKTRKALEKIAKIMGANIQWLYSNKQFNGKFDEKTNTIYLTLDSSITEGVQFIFGHEMTHEMRTKNPAAYDELKTIVKDMMGEDALNSETDKMQIRYEKGGARYWNNRNAIEEEVVADQLGIWIRDANYAHTLLLKMSHPLLAKLHEIVNRFLMALHGIEISDDMNLILRSIEQAYVKTAKGEVTNSETGEDVSYSLRQKPEPKKKGIGYKVFVLKDGKLYPPMVANPDGAATPVGVWLDADAAPIAGESKTGRPQVKQGGKGTQGGSGKLAYRPGWHLGVVPYAIQFNRKDAEGNKTLFPKNFVFAEVEYAADVDYQEEARQEGINPSGKYQHSLAGLKHLPTDGYYMYRTNPNPETDPWVITGAMKVNRILTRAEQAELVKNAGREPQQIQKGDIVTDDVVNSINQEIAAAPKFSLKVYHGSGADFTEFDFDHMGEGEGTQSFGWGGYVTSSPEIGKYYAESGRKDKYFVYNGEKLDWRHMSATLSGIVGMDGVSKADNFLVNVDRMGVEKAKQKLKDSIDEYQKLYKENQGDFYKKQIDVMKKLLDLNLSVETPKTSLYEVDIPDDNGNNYLDWDTPITDELIDKVAKALPSLRSYDIKDLKKDRTFGNLYKTISMRSVKDDASFNDDKAASKLLSSLGYTGIKYKAGRNFGGAEVGDTNYVIFKPEDMKITEHTKFSLKSKPVRFEAGKKLSDEEKKEVLSTLKDAYKVNGVPYHIEETAGGKEKRVYEPTADSYVVSDITNRPLRYYITLPDGRVAHPTEVYPNISDNEVKSSATKQGLLDEEVDQIVSAAIGNMKGIADNAKAVEVLTELQNLPHETHDVGYGLNHARSYNYKTGIFTSDAAQAIDYVVRRMRRKEDVPAEIPAALKKAVADSYGMVDNLIDGMSNTKVGAAEIKPVGVGAFGNIYNQFRGKAKAAIEFLKKLGSGEAAAALHHHTIGDISLVWGDKKTGLDKILRKHPEVVDNLQSIIDSMEVVQESDNRIKLESPTHFAVVSKEYKGEPREQWLLTAYEKRESLENGKSMDTATSSLGGDTALSQSKESAAKIDNSSETAKENGEKFSLKDEKTMFGMHNISIDKLRKAIKQGGFAAPSMGVVDSKNGIYSDYGEITLIPKAEKLAKRTGKNAGTFTADAWTPTYPQVERIMNKQGEKAFNTDMNEKLGDVDNGIYSNIRESWKGYFSSGDVRDGLYWHYLFDKGMNPETIYQTGKYDNDITNEVMRISDNGSKTDYTDEEVAELIQLKNKVTGEDNDVEAMREKLKARIASAEKKGNHLLAALKKKRLAELEGVENFYIAADFVNDVVRNNRKNGKVDVHDTMSVAKEKVENDKKLSADFPSWLDKKTEEYGVEEMLYNGTTPSGKPKYIPNTIDNAVKLMKKQGVAGGYTAFGSELGVFIAKNSPEVNTLAAMKKAKDKLIPFGDERHNQIKDKITKEFLELSDEIRVGSNNRYAFDDSGVSRMVELTDHKGNEKEYLKKAYNIEVSDEWMDRYNKLLDTIKKDYKVFYFETKFMRPYGLDEFEKAIVPSDTPSDVVDALKKAGIDVSSYERGNTEDRQKVTMDAINSSDNIRFSLKEEKEKIVADAKANGTYMTAPNGEKTKLNAEQWSTVRTTNFKNWFGDWENDPENASKVVDENGEPMVVWHGRSAEFNTFEKKEGVRFIMGLEDKVKAEGFFFSPDKGLAEEFASNSSRHRGGKANVVPCFLNIRRPMDLTGEDYDRIYEDVTGWEYMVGMDTQDNLWGIMDEEGMADKIKEKGYDGAIFVEEVDDSYEPTKISYCALDANQIKSAENNNGDFSADNNDIRFSLAGERGAATADKAEERTARIDNLSVARKMEEEKKDAKAIKMATGWERGADGKWRYEMPDAMIKDTMDVGGGHIVKRYEDDMLWNGGKLSDVIDAPELFKAYPHLKDVRIETDAIMNDMPSNGEYNAKTNTITIHADELKYMNSILNHEIQHAIQSIEGFDRGGSPRLVRGEIKKRLAEVTKQIRQLRAEGKEEEAKSIVEKNRGLYNAYQANDDYNSYKSLAGEVEARNVQERMNMTPEERRRTLAESTEDVARKDQIFLGVGDVSFSLRDMADGKESGAADMAEDLKSLNTPDEVDNAIKTAIDDMPSGWQMANKKMIHIAQALGENRKAEISGEEPKFSLKAGTLIKAGTYFSGGGLVEEGLKGIIDPVVAVEHDEKISGVYRNNFGQHIVTADVRDVDPKELVNQIDGEVEYFHASPVCKNYSQAKSNHAEVELDKETAASTAEFINAVKPKVVTIENVKGYKDSDAMKIITDALDANDYTWDADVYNAADYGGYTNRERLIVRAVRDGNLPAKPKKMAHKSGWYEAVEDIIPTLTEKKNGVAPWMDIRLKADGIDWRNIDKPLYVMGSAYADGKVPHAFADELLPTLRTKSGDVIVMPDGKVYRAMGRVLARVSGVSDDYKMPFSENLSHTIIGNGIPTQLTEHVIAPLLQNTLRPTTPEDGNTKFSLRYDKFEHDLNQWKKDNNLPKDAQRPTIPQRNAGESAVDFLRRVDEYRKQMALWKTAPTYEQHLLSDDTALGEFNRELQKGSVLKRIAFQDSMLAIRKAQEAIMKEVGVDRLNMAEDAYTAENRSHGKGKNEFEEYNNEFLQPLRKAYHQMKKILGDSYDNVRIYMMAKHGLERDAQMAFKKSLDADFEDVAQRSAAYRAYKGDMNRITNDSDLEFGRVDFNTWRQRDNALRTKYSPSYMDYRYDENGIAYDYSGLSALFGGSDFEEAAHKLVRDIESSHVAEVQDLWNATNAATKKILRDGYKAGMMSKDTYLYVRDMYSHYIPLRGWDGTTADQVWDYVGGGKGAFNQTLKTAHGRTSIADDPIAYIENMAESGILLNNKNWVKQHLMLLAQNHPTSLLTLSKAWYVKSTDANGNEEWIPATPQITSQMNSNQVKATIDAFEKKMEQMAATGDATQKRDGLNIAYPQTHSEEREHEVRVMKDGEEYVIYVNGDPQLAQAMNNTRAHRVREIQSGKLDRAAAWLGRKMAAAYTSLSPLFIPSNYFRDLTMTLASTAIREDGRYNYLLRKNMATSWNLGFMLRDYQNGKLREKVSNGNATAKEQMFYDFMMNGGETGFVSSLDVEDLKKKFKNDLKDLDRWKTNPVKVGHTIMDGIEFLNRMIEDSNRFAVYMTSIQYGRSIDEAVNDAKDVTINFNRKGTGEYGWQMIRNLYLFINPAVQSLQTLGALTKHHPFKFTAVTAAWLASGVLVPIVNAALMSLLGGDDDKDKYWQFTKWDRRNNLIMWVPFTHEYVKIPLAQEFRAFYGIGDMIASKMMGGELAEETWSQYAEDLLGQVVDMLPLDPTGYDGNIAVSLMPNPIRPIFELAFNVDFTGKPLFKETEYNKYDPNFTKAYVGTPDWLVRVSKMVNSIGNDYPDVQQNAIDAFGDPRYNLNNPAVVDHVLSSYLGGAYTMGSQVLGVLTKSLNDPKEIKMADIPLISKFVSNPDDRPVTKKQGDEFWNMKENHDRAANTLSKLKKQAKLDGDYSMLERFYGSEEYKQYKQEDVKVKKYEEDKKKERAEESGEEYRSHKLNAEDIYKAHATPKDDFEDLKLKQLYTKLNGFKTSYDLLVDTAPGQSDGYYNTNKAAIDAIDEISLDKQEISELKKGFLEDGKDAYNAEDMKRIRELRKRILSVLEPANKVVVANQKAKAEKK